jgi:mRNA interferase MazF
MATKDFEGWHKLKQHIQETHRPPTFKHRELWWCSIGVNIGDEMDGKNKFFNRPVLVIRKFNEYIFYGIPMTTKIKDNPYYFPVTIKGEKQCVLISQMRLYDSRRLTHLMGKMSQDTFNEVREAVKALL